LCAWYQVNRFISSGLAVSGEGLLLLNACFSRHASHFPATAFWDAGTAAVVACAPLEGAAVPLAGVGLS
jgi:hypothetical protein